MIIAVLNLLEEIEKRNDFAFLFNLITDYSNPKSSIISFTLAYDFAFTFPANKSFAS